jgi:hypothetical protein
MFKQLLSTPQGFLSFIRTVEILAFVAVFAIMIFQAVPLTLSNNDLILSYATQQRTLSQRIAKNAFILQYGPTSDDAQAISELQNMLPTWESDQANLQNSNLPETDEILLLSSATNYVGIDTAVRAILAHPQNAPIEAEIIHTQERPYFLALSQIANQLQQQEYSSRTTLIIIGELTCVILLAIKTIFVVTVEMAARRYAKEQRERQQEK